MQLIPLLKNQSVRDLAWSCFGNNLINDFSAINHNRNVSSCKIPLTDQRRQWLTDLDNKPEVLIRYLQQSRSPRLGVYFERLWQYFIEQDDEFELIANNLQIHQHGKTLGEFDLIYKNHLSGHYVHLELAVKFYLNCSILRNAEAPAFDPGFRYWLGPNAIDRLDKKVARLVNHQILLADNTAAKTVLEKLQIPTLERNIALKGTLFYPHCIASQQPQLLDSGTTALPLAVDHHFGYWITAKQFSALLKHTQHWKVINRNCWISPAYHHTAKHTQELMNGLAMNSWLQQHFTQYRQPVMLGLMADIGADYSEQQRYFVTPEQWPDKALRKELTATDV